MDPINRSALARRYRRLLATYPRDYRRRYGPEIVTTLLDAAPAGRTWPSRSEAADLLLAGVRFRLRVRGPGPVLAAICATAYMAVALGALGGFLGWQTARPLPGNSDAIRMVQPVLRPGAAVEPRRWDFLFDDDPGYTDPRWAYWLGGTDTYRHGQVFVDYPFPEGTPDDAVAVEVAGAGQRMRAAGWQVTDPGDPATAAPASGYRQGWRMDIRATFLPGESGQVLRIAISRDTPTAVPVLTVAGLLIGGLAGWLLAAGLCRRGRSMAGPRRATAALLFAGAMLALLPATAMSTVALAYGYVSPHELVPAWVGYTFVGFRALAWLGAVALGGTGMVVAIRVPHARPPLPPPLPPQLQ